MDFTSLYSERTKGTPDEDHAEILKVFREKIKSKTDLSVVLINYFRGLPLTYPANVVAIEFGNLEIDINPQQAAAIGRDRYTLIRSRLFTDVILASVQSVDIKRHLVSIKKLGYVELLADNRSAVRLHLEPPVEVTVKYLNEIYKGNVQDISLHGIAILMDRDMSLDIGTRVMLEFNLPDLALQKQTPMELLATLVAVKGDSQLYQYKFRISPQKEKEQLISRYSLQRQIEIIRDLKEIVER